MIPKFSADDFTPAASPVAPSSKSTGLPVLVWVLAGLGCSFLALIILGVIAAIALPTFLNQASKAKESEAKTYLQAMLRGQQAYFLDQGEFATTIEQLELGLNSETMAYSYELVAGADDYQTFVYAKPKDATTRGFAGAVYVAGDPPATAALYTGLCSGDELGQAPPAPPALDIDLAEPEVVCPPGSSWVD